MKPDSATFGVSHWNRLAVRSVQQGRPEEAFRHMRACAAAFSADLHRNGTFAESSQVGSASDLSPYYVRISDSGSVSSSLSLEQGPSLPLVFGVDTLLQRLMHGKHDIAASKADLVGSIIVYNLAALMQATATTRNEALFRKVSMLYQRSEQFLMRLEQHCQSLACHAEDLDLFRLCLYTNWAECARQSRGPNAAAELEHKAIMCLCVVDPSRYPDLAEAFQSLFQDSTFCKLTKMLGAKCAAAA